MDILWEFLSFPTIVDDALFMQARGALMVVYIAITFPISLRVIIDSMCLVWIHLSKFIAILLIG